MSTKISAIYFIFLSAFVFARAQSAESKYTLATEILIPGDAKWDYLSVDEKDHRLFVSHGNEVVVIDTDSNKIIGQVSNTPGVHGIAIAPDLGRGFSSNGKEAKISIFDLKTLETVKKVATGDNPDAILYAPDQHEVYAFNGKSNSVSVIDGKTGNAVATIPLPGKPEFAAADPFHHRVFVNIEDKNSISVIDTLSHKAVASWPIAPGEECSGMTIDSKNQRVFFGCHNKMVLMIDSSNGQVIDHAAIGSGVDSNWFDPKTKIVFSSNGDGTISMAREESPGKLVVLPTLNTKPRSRTMALDTVSHRLYVPAADFEAPKADQPRGVPVPGTFKILVYEAK
jgi:YVTN family beta-propeller protein